MFNNILKSGESERRRRRRGRGRGRGRRGRGSGEGNGASEEEGENIGEVGVKETDKDKEKGFFKGVEAGDGKAGEDSCEDLVYQISSLLFYLLYLVWWQLKSNAKK